MSDAGTRRRLLPMDQPGGGSPTQFFRATQPPAAPPIGGRIGVLAAVATAAAAVFGTLFVVFVVLYKNETNKDADSAPRWVEDAATGCLYSTERINQIDSEVALYIATYLDNCLPVAGTGDFTLFTGEFVPFQFVHNDTDALSNPVIAHGTALMARIDAELATTNVYTDMERFGLIMQRQEVAAWVNFTRINWMQSVYSQAFWWIPPPMCDVWEIRWFGSLFADEPDYDDKMLRYVVNSAAGYAAYEQYLLDVLAKTSAPRHVANVHEIAADLPLYQQAAQTGLFTAACNAITNTTKRQQCLDAMPARDAAAAALYATVAGPWATACAEDRPDSNPGLQDAEAHQIWLRYWTLLDNDNAAVHQLGLDTRQTYVDGIDTLMNAIAPGQDFDDYVTRARNYSDWLFWFCSTNREDLKNHIAGAAFNYSQHLHTEEGRASRAFTTLATRINGAWNSVSTPLGYNYNSNVWQNRALFTIGTYPAGGGVYCVPRGPAAVVLHEWAGHAHQIPKDREVACRVRSSRWAIAGLRGWAEGYATYMEEACQYTPICANDRAQAIDYYANRMRMVDGMVLDAAMHGSSSSAPAFSRAQCIAFQVDDGFRTFDAEEICDLIISQPGVWASYLYSYLHIKAQRERAAAALGSVFVPREFNLMLTKFGRIPLSELASMTDTFIVWRVNRTAAVNMPYYELLDNNLFSRAIPVVGRGKRSFITGQLTNAVAVATAADNAAQARLQAFVQLAIDNGSFDSINALLYRRTYSVLERPNDTANNE